MREILVGTIHFNELYRALPGLSRSLLASRVRYLQHKDIVVGAGEAAGTRGRAKCYTLTPSGYAFRPVLEALDAGALDWRLPTEEDDAANVALLLWRMQQSIERSALPNRKVVIQFLFEASDTACGWLQVGTDTASTCVGTTERDVDLTMRTTPQVLSDLWWGRRACEQTIADRKIVFGGHPECARQFNTWFGNQAVRQMLIMSRGAVGQTS